jgi:hypothetical protein
MRPAVAVVATLSLLAGCDRTARDASDANVHVVCAGLPDALMDRGVADLRANVEAVGPLREADGAKTLPRLVGATVQVRAAPGMTAPWLGRLLRCDTARHAAAALVPDGASAEVTSTPVGFTVAVRSRDAALAREIDRRASLFAHPVQAACNTREYLWNETWNAGGPGRCASDCECDGLRTCIGGRCEGAAR